MPAPSTSTTRSARLGLAALLVLGLAGGWQLCLPARSTTEVLAGEPPATPAADQAPQAGGNPLDPAAWGSDHVDAELPEFIEQGECLFCHRIDVGNTWQTDLHANTVRDAPPDHPAVRALAAHAEAAPLLTEVGLLVGGETHARFARRSATFGKLDLLSLHADRGRGRSFRLVGDLPGAWDNGDHFAERCAGCHASGVEREGGTFFAVGHDCFVCHGDVPLEHTEETELVYLAKARRDPPQVVTSLCAQCHLRGGSSRATGRPYATNFVAGDNLFRDYQIDWSLADDPRLNPGDRHVIQNVRDVVLAGQREITCLSCHQVHGNDTRRHRELPVGPSCAVCHEPGKPLSEPTGYEVHSKTCEY